MWQVTALAPLQEFWHRTDEFVMEYLAFARALQLQGLTAAALQAAAANPPGRLAEVLTEKLQGYLVRLVQCTDLPAVIRGFGRAVSSYEGYLTYPDQPLTSVSASTHALLHETFKYMYEDLMGTKCFRETYMGLKGRGATGSQYRKLFGGLHRVCPYCDLELIAKLPNSQIDHFLAKSQHPLLAIHGSNLVVSCVSCNAGVKSTTPIGHDEAAVENLPIFHPFYDQPADHLCFRFNRTVTKVWIRSTSPGTVPAIKVRHWAQVFGLEGQYEAHLHTLRTLARTLRDRTIQAFRLVQTQGGIPDLERIYDGILAFEAEKVQAQVRFEPLTKLTLDFLEFLRRTRRQEDLAYIRSQL